MSADFRGKGASSTNHCWCQKTRVIVVSCGIKIFAVRCLVLSQYTHLTDGRTDGQTEFRQQYRACITCSRTVKTHEFERLRTVNDQLKSSATMLPARQAQSNLPPKARFHHAATAALSTAPELVSLHSEISERKKGRKTSIFLLSP